jgi:hypothetical protein
MGIRPEVNANAMAAVSAKKCLPHLVCFAAATKTLAFVSPSAHEQLETSQASKRSGALGLMLKMTLATCTSETL